MTLYNFVSRTGKITINHESCKNCKTFACVKACSFFGINLLRIRTGIPVLTVTPQEAERRCVEDLSCELYCQKYGNKGLYITLNMFGLEEYRDKIKI